jgi:hypothetical protein
LLAPTHAGAVGAAGWSGSSQRCHRDGRHKDQEARVGFTLKQRVVRRCSLLAPCEASYTRPVAGELERSLRPGGDRQIAFPNMRARPAASQKTLARLSCSFAYGCREERCDDSEYVELAWTISTITPSQPRRSLMNIDLTDGINANLLPSHRRSRRCAWGGAFTFALLATSQNGFQDFSARGRRQQVEPENHAGTKR